MIEIRELTAATTTSAEEEKKIVEGVVNKPSQKSEVLHDKNGLPFIEMIMPNAFAEAIEQAENIRLLLNHDNSKVLADTKTGTLVIEEKDGQVTMKAELVETTDGKDAYELVKKQLSGGLSFGFTTLEDEWQEKDGMYQRTVKKMVLSEISIVSDPAYSQSKVEARSIEVPTQIQIKKEVTKNMETLIKETRENTTLSQILKGETRDLSTTISNGAIIPTQVADTIIEKVVELSNVFDKATKIKSENGHLQVAVESVNNVATFVEEGSNAIEQQLATTSKTLTQKRLATALSLSNQLLNDSKADLTKFVENKLARSIAQGLEKAIISGNGTTEFEGVTVAKDIEEVKLQAITVDELLKLTLTLPSVYRQNAMFVMDKATHDAIALMKNGNNDYIMANGITNGKLTETLFGYEVQVSNNMSASTPIIFGSFTDGYTIMLKDEQQLQIINDGQQALRGSKLHLYDIYADGCVTNVEAFVKVSVQE